MKSMTTMLNSLARPNLNTSTPQTRTSSCKDIAFSLHKEIGHILALWEQPGLAQSMEKFLEFRLQATLESIRARRNQKPESLPSPEECVFVESDSDHEELPRAYTPVTEFSIEDDSDDECSSCDEETRNKRNTLIAANLQPKEEMAWTQPKLCTRSPRIIQATDECLKSLISMRHHENSLATSFEGFPKLLFNTQFSDAKLFIGPNRVYVPAHKAILSERSKLFEQCLRIPGVDSLHLETRHYRTVKEILRYLYTGKLEHSEHPGYLTRLYIEADYFGIGEIKSHVVNYVKTVVAGGVSSVIVDIPYILCLLRGLAECVKASDCATWDDFKDILCAIVKHESFNRWLGNAELHKFLGETGVVATILLYNYKEGITSLLEKQEEEEKKRKEKEEGEKHKLVEKQKDESQENKGALGVGTSKKRVSSVGEVSRLGAKIPSLRPPSIVPAAKTRVPNTPKK
ncbi:hypothetical protein ABW19_dt0207920 [Dactylella cylindrospora]|nr:hypothetical protein ABW19_dt0207920 [Dactylella cylindrospora]